MLLLDITCNFKHVTLLSILHHLIFVICLLHLIKNLGDMAKYFSAIDFRMDEEGSEFEFTNDPTITLKRRNLKT